MVDLTALVDDPEASGTVDSRDYVIWRRHLGTSLGTGPVLQTRDLAVGVHTIDLIVTDSSGAAVTATVDVEIVERTTPTRRGQEPDPAAVAILTADDFVAPTTSTTTPPVDTDGDGLPDPTEAEIGSDPTNPDTDGDVAEAQAATDPLDPADHP